MTNLLRRLAERLSPGDPQPHEEAAERTARSMDRIERQQVEAQRLSRFALLQIRENHLAEKIRLALREG